MYGYKNDKKKRGDIQVIYLKYKQGFWSFLEGVILQKRGGEVKKLLENCIMVTLNTFSKEHKSILLN